MALPAYARLLLMLAAMSLAACGRSERNSAPQEGKPAAWKELSGLLDDDDARLRAINGGLTQGPDGETKGMLLINKALILDRRGDRDGAVEILGGLALDPQSTLGTELLAKAALGQIVR